MPRANEKMIYRCKECKRPAVEIMRATFSCRSNGCSRNNGTGESVLFGLPDWIEEVPDDKRK